jgi:hypothetical protein
VTLGLAGRATATVGIVCGLLVLGLQLGSQGGHYVDDGTSVAFLVILLALASHFPAETGRDASGAAQGAAAFGFLLFIPFSFAPRHLGFLGPAGWLGVCTALIPIGFAMLRLHERAPADPVPTRVRRDPSDPRLAVPVVGLALIVVGIWLEVFSGGNSYWDRSHALALLMLVLVALNALLLFGIWTSPDSALLVATTTFGLVEYAWIQRAFTHLGDLGAGGWIEAFGGLFLLLGVLWLRRAATAPVRSATPAPAAAK